nr:RNA cytidine acetyltransferase 1-like isoform X1 [Ipomoea batatas]
MSSVSKFSFAISSAGYTLLLVSQGERVIFAANDRWLSTLLLTTNFSQDLLMNKKTISLILCVLSTYPESSIKSVSAGCQPFGDQIPWKFCQQFNVAVFPSLSGARSLLHIQLQ